MVSLVSNPKLADFVISEASAQRSRKNARILQTGVAVLSGTLLSAAAAGQGAFERDDDATGNFTSSSVAVASAAQTGLYEIEFTSPTAFTVTAPDGSTVGTGATGTAFNTGGLTFTLTAGATAAVAGDRAYIAAVEATELYRPFDTGTGDAIAILYNHLPAATGMSRAVVFDRDCEVNRHALTGLTDAAVAMLDAKGIRVRGTPNLGHVSTPALD